jgi:hypothetical protein
MGMPPQDDAPHRSTNHSERNQMATDEMVCYLPSVPLCHYFGIHASPSAGHGTIQEKDAKVKISDRYTRTVTSTWRLFIDIHVSLGLS